MVETETMNKEISLISSIRMLGSQCFDSLYLDDLMILGGGKVVKSKKGLKVGGVAFLGSLRGKKVHRRFQKESSMYSVSACDVIYY